MLARLKAQSLFDRLPALHELMQHIATDERVLPAVLEILANHQEDDMRMAAARGLAGTAPGGVPEALSRRIVDSLTNAFRHDRGYSVRWQAAKSLASLGWRPEDPAEQATSAAIHEDLATLRQMIANGRRDVVEAAVGRELADNSNHRMLCFVRAERLVRDALIAAVEKLVRYREQLGDKVRGEAGVAAAVSLGFDASEARLIAKRGERSMDAVLIEARDTLAAMRVSATGGGALRGALRRVTGRSLFYRCPSCGVTLRKRSVEGVADAFGFTSCSECAASFNYANVYYAGQYDLPEVEGTCGACGATLRGPETELVGKPCPACGADVPAAASG